MIYIFQGFQSICSLPGMACRACGDCCAQLNCKPIKACCDCVGKGRTHFMERPLSTYVIVSFALSGATLYAGYSGLDTGCVLHEGAWVTFSWFCYIVMAFAVVNLAFCLYFQSAVWRQIMEDKEQFTPGGKPHAARRAAGTLLGGIRDQANTLRGKGSEGAQATPAEPASTKPSKLKVPREVVQAGFKKTFLEDFVVLFYFFGLVAMTVLCVQGGSPSPESAQKQCQGVATWLPELGSAFFGVALFYTLCWYCCKCCAGTVELENDAVYEQVDADEAGP